MNAQNHRWGQGLRLCLTSFAFCLLTVFPTVAPAGSIVAWGRNNEGQCNVPCPNMVFIPGGEFQMGDHFNEGDSHERPVHAVYVDSFYMSRYETTNGQYCDYLNSADDAGDIKVDGGIVYASSDSSNSYPYCDTHSHDSHSQIDYSGVTFNVRNKGSRDMSNDPMVEVSWYGAAAYCNWRSNQEGYEAGYNLSIWKYDFCKNGYRLPTEAEWEYAARGELSGRRFPWGDTITHSQANYKSSSLFSYDISPTRSYHPTWNDGIYPYTSPVGSFAANGYGLYDILGNVWEWCNDGYSSTYYSVSPYDNPTGTVSGTYRVSRGGGWYGSAPSCRLAARFDLARDYRSFVGGFRVVLPVCPSGAEWRSSLYPEDWTPGYKDSQGRFLHDFSYASYHKGEADIPINPPGSTVDVTQAPYYADNTGDADATAAIQAAIDTVGNAGGGIVYLPTGTYKLTPPGSSDWALHIPYSAVVLRGEGPGKTFLFNDETNMRKKSVILVGPNAPNGWHPEEPDITVAITEDVDYPAFVIPVAETEPFDVGDWVVLRTNCTESFIAEHGMTGKWNSGLKGITFYRMLKAVDSTSNTITVDIPTRYYLKTRDNARVYKVDPHLEEIGIERLSIGMRENLTPGLGEDDYYTKGTAAYEVHGSHFIKFDHVVNGWIQDVETYRPPCNTNDWHTLSNIILLNQSRNVTVRNCVVSRPEYEGAGGNGYGYTLRGNDCLLIDCTALHTRHNYDFKSMWTSGNVIFRCKTVDGYKASDFHMHLSPVNLFDNMYVDGDFLDAKYRNWGSPSSIHGQTTTESVFWNTYGTERCTEKVIVSRQWKWGYVIGTSGPVHTVERGIQDNTAPEDFLEGQGQGETLVPQSLYLDQLYRRRGKDLDFSKRVDLADLSVFARYWMNGCTNHDWCYGCDYDRSGCVDFKDLNEFMDYWLLRTNP